MFDEAGEQTFGDIGPAGGSPCVLDGVVQIVTVFFPVAWFGYPWQACLKCGFDKAVLPVSEGGGECFFDFIVGQFVGVVAAGAEEVEGIADNHDRRLAATAAIIFF